MVERDDEDGALTQAAALAAMVFRETQWTWTNSGDVKYVPSASDVRACLERLLDSMRDGGSWAKGTGRLVVEKDELNGYSLLMRLGNIAIDEESGA